MLIMPQLAKVIMLQVYSLKLIMKVHLLLQIITFSSHKPPHHTYTLWVIKLTCFIYFSNWKRKPSTHLQLTSKGKKKVPEPHLMYEIIIRVKNYTIYYASLLFGEKILALLFIEINCRMHKAPSMCTLLYAWCQILDSSSHRFWIKLEEVFQKWISSGYKQNSYSPGAQTTRSLFNQMLRWVLILWCINRSI